MESIVQTNISTDCYKEESIPLISWDNETNMFVVGEEAKQMLKGVKGPIGVIAVAGQYRTGKSYLLNRMLLNRSDGFGVGPSINPCTKGLWVWGTPISGFTPEGQPINVLVVDSEGIGGLDEDNNHDMRIFSLAMLLSSYFIYNSTGSIDENALNNLSLVVNLTKHIQFKAQVQEDITNQDDISEYFPSFMWVVRDFALQLVDEDSKELTAREYFEKALLERGGPSDAKNEIRKHLKKYFVERECCTMIRPLTNEDELQNLAQMDMSELRAEFVEQVMNLRRKVLNKTKPKMIDGQTMDGQTWCQLIEQYVNAINEGAVPNIQSSWQYISRQRASQAVDTCKQAFEQELNESVSLPMDQQDLEYTLKDLKTVTEQKYEKLSKGDEDIIKEYAQELQEFIIMRSAQIRTNNNDECKKYAEEMIQQLFAEFDQQIKSAGPQLDPSQVDITLKQLHDFYNNNAIEFAEKDLILAEAKAAFLQEALHYFSKNYQSEITTSRQMESQTRERLEEQLKEAKDDSKTERYRVEDKLRQVQLEKAEIDAGHQFIKEQYEYIKQAKEQDEQEYKAQIQKLKDENYSCKDILRTQSEDFEEQIQSMQRHLIQVESGFDKEKALFEQKVSYLEKALQEKSTKEKDSQSEWHLQKSEMSNEIKQLTQKYDKELKSLLLQFEEEKERSVDLEVQLKDKLQILEEKEAQWNEQEISYKMMLTSSQDQQKILEAALSSIRKENDKQMSSTQKELEGKTEYLQQQVDQLETQLKETSELLKSKENDFKKERAIKDQKVDFLEMQLSECKQQLEETYRQHEAMVNAMKQEGSPKSKNNGDSDQIESLQNELQRTSEAYQEQLDSLKYQSDQYLEKITELELQNKLIHGDYDRDVNELKQQISEIDQVRNAQQEKIKQLESQRGQIMEESENKIKLSIQQLEEELEEKEKNTQQEIKDMQEKSEQALAQLKNFYEIEKENLEQRVGEERDRSTRRINQFQEELETRIREEVSEKEEEIEMLQNELRSSEQNNQSYMIQAEHDLSLKQQMIESLERQVKDARERLESMEFGRNSAFERQIEHFEQQRQEYNQKIDKLQLENLEKDRQLAQLQHKLERMADDLERKKTEFESNKVQLEKDKKQLTEKCELVKKKLNEAQDSAMQQKLEFGREQALSKQQNEFQTKKIEEMHKQIEENQRSFDEKIKSYKQEIQDEAFASVERITSEKELWESKYEQKRRALKEIEQSLSRTNNELEKKVSLLTQQIEKFDDEKQNLEQNYQDEITNLQLQIQQLDSSAGAAYYYGSAHAEDVMKLKTEVQDLERELSDLQSTYDRDKALWEGKCQFLENQKETYKRDLIESQKKFEITLEQLQKRGSLDKDKFEYNQQALIKVIESKFKNQIKEINETHQCLQNDSQSKIKRLEGEIKILNEKVHLEARGKLSEYSQLERRVQELLDTEKKLQAELEQARNDRDRRNFDQHRQQDKEKEIYKQKLGEYEQKAKDSENRRAALMFEFEKERAKWQLEKDSLVGQKSEMYEQIERLTIKKDQLLRENEKLKNENKGSRKYLFQNVSNIQPSASTSTSTSANRYQINKSISGQNGNILNSAINKMKENAKNKYMGDMGDDSSQSTTPNTKHNRYGQY